ncbi:MAG TPA: SPOR domain-containing protein [Thermoanaerobaculia bacterium]|nr:SPOR domain-containing protein [Thermoanaerobaculia bacterium]
MANSHEPSYYEIALTNRQVVVAFVILLVCLVTAFFSGVYIGREGTLRDQDQLVRATPPAQKPVDQEGRELEEFEFFEGESRQPASGTLPEETVAEAEPEPGPQDSTLLEDFGGEDLAGAGEPAPAEEEDFVEEEPVPEPEPEPTPARPRRDPEETRQAAAPARQEAPAPPAAPAAARGKVVIQVFSSAEQDQAERIREQLAGGGQSAYLSPVKVGGTTMYRVRIGPFDSRADANKVAERVRKSHKLDTWITEE